MLWGGMEGVEENQKRENRGFGKKRGGRERRGEAPVMMDRGQRGNCAED